MRTSIVILNWNGAQMLRRFLPTVLSNTPKETAEIIVADNGSTDNSLEILDSEFPEVRVIALDKNYGFAEGYNQALRRVGDNYDYYLLLNSDVETPEAWIQPLVQYMEDHADVAACQPKLRAEHTPTHFEYAGGAGGYIDYLGYPFCRGRVFGVVEPDLGQYDDVADVFWATGAALMIRAKVYEKHDGNEYTDNWAYHTMLLPFTRFMAGAADYTFCYPGYPRELNGRINEMR